jgi:hypothetical protein
MSGDALMALAQWKPSTGGNAPHRDDTNDPTVLRSPCGVPGLSRIVATPHGG